MVWPLKMESLVMDTHSKYELVQVWEKGDDDAFFVSKKIKDDIFLKFHL